jgi:septin family protein
MKKEHSNLISLTDLGRFSSVNSTIYHDYKISINVVAMQDFITQHGNEAAVDNIIKFIKDQFVNIITNS